MTIEFLNFLNLVIGHVLTDFLSMLQSLHPQYILIKKVYDASNIRIHGQALPQCNENRLLGAVIYDKLSFGNHIDSVCKKVCRLN